MGNFFKQSQGILFFLATALGALGLLSSEQTHKQNDVAPQVLSAEADHPLVENAQPVYDGRRVRVEAEVVRQPGRQSACQDCANQSCKSCNAATPANPAPNGILDDFAGKILSEVSHAQAQGVARTRVFRLTVRERERVRDGGRPRLFRRR